jgi:hypothetical protein
MSRPPVASAVAPHENTDGLWLDEHYRTWRRRIYVPSAENVGLSSRRHYDLRHTWAPQLIAEKRLSIAELAEQTAPSPLGGETGDRGLRKRPPRRSQTPSPRDENE